MAADAKKSKRRGKDARAASSVNKKPGNKVSRDAVPRGAYARLKYYARFVPWNAGWIGAGVIAVLVATIFYQFLFQSRHYEVDQWDFAGLDRLTTEEAVRIASGDPEGEAHLLKLSLDEARERLAAHPAVYDAHLRKFFPNRVEGIVKERKERALLISKAGAYLVDVEGVVFARAKPNELRDTTLPVFTGPTDQMIEVGESLDPEFRDRALLYAETIERTGGLLDDKLSEIHWEPGEGITLYLRGGARLLCGNREPWETLPKLEALSREIGSVALIDYADLRLDTDLPWRPSGDVSAQQLAQRP